MLCSAAEAHPVPPDKLRHGVDVPQVLLRPGLRVEVQPEVQHQQVASEAVPAQFDQRRQHVLRDLRPIVRPHLRSRQSTCAVPAASPLLGVHRAGCSRIRLRTM